MTAPTARALRLVVLGSGTCVPGARSSSGYWIDAGAVRVRLDCGAGTVHAMGRLGLPWETLTHQFVGHFHIDHAGELPALLFALKHGRSGPRDLPLGLVGPRGLGALLDGLCRAFGSALLDQAFPVSLQELAPGDALRIGEDVILRVTSTPHTAESLAVRVERGGRAIGYTGDTAPSDDLAAFFQGVDVLIAECSFLEPSSKTPHLGADDVARLASAAEVGRLVATHSYFDPVAADLAARLARTFHGPIDIAHDGLALEVF